MAAKSEAGTFTVEDYEFKVTVLPEEEQKVHDVLQQRGVTPVQRTVYFFDTPTLTLFKEHRLVVRARVTDDDDDDSTVKLRPLPHVVPARWIATEKVEFGVDVVGERAVFTAKVDHKPDPGRVKQVAQGALKPAKLLNKSQEALIEERLPLEQLVLLGHVNARKWNVPPDPSFRHELAVEEWSLRDIKVKFLELSFKVAPADGEGAKREFDALLERLGIEPDPDPEPKTTTVIERLAKRLRG